MQARDSSDWYLLCSSGVQVWAVALSLPEGYFLFVLLQPGSLLLPALAV